MPWQLVYWLVRSSDFMSLHLPLEADSLLGLIQTAPSLVDRDQMARLGVHLHAFTVSGSTVPPGAH